MKCLGAWTGGPSLLRVWMHYRPEIDGLRAIAIAPVILFHAGLALFSGGFVGVDVFFVISGYLITGIILSDLDANQFSITSFYERRIRRIFPALFTVILACLPFAYAWMLPLQTQDFLQSLAAVATFSSNFLFWREGGYFGAASELKPLLHTWSLSVEEQFYFVFPVTVLLMWRIARRNFLAILTIFCAASFAFAVWATDRYPGASFYLAPTRAWELLAGSICALIERKRAPRPSSLGGGLGLVLILGSVFFFDADTPTPGFHTLLPVIGSVLIVIFARPPSLVARLLSLSPFVGLGLLSYSAYLWHQPLFAFARIRSLGEPALPLMMVLSGAAIALAWLTWHFIEQPFRRKDNRALAKRATLFLTAAGLTLGLLFIGAFGQLGSGMRWRFNDAVLRLADAETEGAWSPCHYTGMGQPNHPNTECLVPDSRQNVEVLILGDSHALAMSGALGASLRASDIGFYETHTRGCMPVLGLRRFDVNGVFDCENFTSAALDYAEKSGISTVVLFARYPLYVLGTRFDNGEGGHEGAGSVWVDDSSRSHSYAEDPERIDRVLAIFDRSLRGLAHRFNVVVVYPVPEAGWHVPQMAAKRLLYAGDGSDLSTSLERYRDRVERIDATLQTLLREVQNLHVARVDQLLCREDTRRCINSDTSGVYYFDNNHLSKTGAQRVSPVILSTIKAALTSSPPRP